MVIQKHFWIMFFSLNLNKESLQFTHILLSSIYSYQKTQFSCKKGFVLNHLLQLTSVRTI